MAATSFVYWYDSNIFHSQVPPKCSVAQNQPQTVRSQSICFSSLRDHCLALSFVHCFLKTVVLYILSDFLVVYGRGTVPVAVNPLWPVTEVPDSYFWKTVLSPLLLKCSLVILRWQLPELEVTPRRAGVGKPQGPGRTGSWKPWAAVVVCHCDASGHVWCFLLEFSSAGCYSILSEHPGICKRAVEVENSQSY